MARRSDSDLAPLWTKLERTLRAEPAITSLERRLRLLEGKLLAALSSRERALFLQYEALLNERQALALERALEVGGESPRRAVAKKGSNDG